MNIDSQLDASDSKDRLEPSLAGDPARDYSLVDLISMRQEAGADFEPEQMGLRARVPDF
ncbi:hypothetical protein [Brevibacterium atlanticum]|uniref:hypothetical protein n=1 Tax=Brevibacterium atlanticum TaxID=2697563 RepID=UPI00141E115A|nr:hypothetical protein [Brevibacterium atlanticum]